MLWRGSQGKPIEARLANHHIKYLHGTAGFRTRRGNMRRRDGGCAGAGAKFDGVVTPGRCGGMVGVRIGLTCKG